MCNKKFIKAIISLIIFSSYLAMDSYDLYSQNLVISAGSTFSCTGGKEVIKSNLINNSSFRNNNNLIVFSGSVQSLSGSIPIDFENISVEAGSTASIITPGQTLKSILLCNGTLNANGNITLLSTSAGTALIDGSGGGQVLGNVTMQRYLPSGFGYHYFSSPFQDATVDEFSNETDLPDSLPTLFTYIESRISSGWVGYKYAANLLIPLQGYAVNLGSAHTPATVDITGVVNNGGLNVTLYNHNNSYTKGFNLIGNPYPSPINWDAPTGWNKTNIDNSLYFFRADSADQYGGVYSTYLNGISSDGLATNIIPSMQGFFIHVSDGAWPVTGTLALNNNVRVNDLTYSFIKSGESASPAYMRLVAGYSDDTLSFDPLIIYLDTKATYGFDSQFDALKLFNTDKNVVNFYSFGNDSSRLSINALPLTDLDSCTIRLGLKTERSGEVIFNIKHIEGDFKVNNLFITDVIAGKSQDLLFDKQYKIFLLPGDYQNRFYLNLSNKVTDIPDISSDESRINIFSYHGILKAEIDVPDLHSGTLEIFNLMGESVYVYKIYQPGYYEFTPNLKAGIYLVSFINGKSRYSKKIFFQ